MAKLTAWNRPSTNYREVRMAGGSREPGRTVISKVLAILDAFEKSRGVLSLTDIAEKSVLPLSTAHRPVNELTDWGLLYREPNGRYQLGIRH
ncbi:helix-turn-helix domain-containing protein [Arthrobacter sp. RHLT1-20]